MYTQGVFKVTKFFQKLVYTGGYPDGIVTNMLNCDIVVSEFKVVLLHSLLD